jgi:acetolactate synthase small subunit
MTGHAYLVRVQDHAGALERFLSTLRRKYMGVESISFFPGPRGVHEVLLKISPTGSGPDRVRAELGSLVDVREVRALGESQTLETREMALARVPSGSGPFLTDRGRLLGQREDCDLIEITGTPLEVDAALADLADRGVLSGFHRTGELPTPEETAQKQRRSSE